MEITYEKKDTKRVCDFLPGEVFVNHGQHYMKTANNLFPAPLPDNIWCVNLTTGGLREFNSTDTAIACKFVGLVKL